MLCRLLCKMAMSSYVEYLSLQTNWVIAMRTLLFIIQLEAADSWENAVDDVMLAFEKEYNRRATYTICYY